MAKEDIQTAYGTLILDNSAHQLFLSLPKIVKRIGFPRVGQGSLSLCWEIKDIMEK